MFDCGVHPGFHGMQSLPYLDLVDLSTVDVALITHFHLDHCAAVPYLVGHTKFKVRSGAGGGPHCWRALLAAFCLAFVAA